MIDDFEDDKSDQEQIVWAPQPGGQEMLVHCPVTLIGFGGSRGGGKTDGVLGKFAIDQERLGEDFNAIFFRKELPQADDLIERAKQIYMPLGAHWQDQKKQFTFRTGGRLRFRPLANDDDAQKFQGQNLHAAAIEEAGNYSDPSPIWKLFGALRGKGGGQIILTFNPGGSGHHWLKEMFIKPWPQGKKILYKELPNGKKFDYIYLPSRVYDNQILLSKDPTYIDRLHMVGSPELVRAWLEGDFEIHEGSYFPEFSSRHIISPFNIPKHWPRYLGYDWGYRSPFAAVWGAVSSGKDDKGKEVPYPRGSIVIYREAWGKGVDNVAQADKIASLSVGEHPTAVADPSIFAHEGGPSINDQFSQVFAKYKHPNFRAADNDRISGWAQIRQRLIAKPALLYIFASCPYLIETLPALAIDKRKAEDADSSGNDHACFVGNTKILTDTGAVTIEALAKLNTFNVLTHTGQFTQAVAQLTQKAAKVIKLKFEDGSEVVCTPEHKFRLKNGSFKEAGSLTSCDAIDCVTYGHNYNFTDLSGVQWGKVLPLRAVFFFAKKISCWLEKAASKNLGIFQWAYSNGFSHTSRRWQPTQQSNSEFTATSSSAASFWAHDGRTEKGSHKIYKTRTTRSDSVAQIISRETVAFSSCKEYCSLNASNHENVFALRQGIPDQKTYGLEIKILSPELQDDSKTKKISSIEKLEDRQDVFCLFVPKTNTFVLDNGAVVHNCDALRYLCKERLIESPWEPPKQVYNKGRVQLQAYVEMVRRQTRKARI